MLGKLDIVESVCSPIKFIDIKRENRFQLRKNKIGQNLLGKAKKTRDYDSAASGHEKFKTITITNEII